MHPASPRADVWIRRLALAQGAFYFVTGMWPLLHLRGFLLVTGPKTDLWLVQTVGALLAVFGAVLFVAGRRNRVTSEWRLLAAGFALTLAAIDIVFVARDVISPIYLADAAVEVPIAIAWLALSRATARTAANS